jgi:hypothetical protein
MKQMDVKTEILEMLQHLCAYSAFIWHTAESDGNEMMPKSPYNYE